MHKIVYIFLLLLVLFGCKNTEKKAAVTSNENQLFPEISPTVELTEIARGQNSGFEKQTFKVIRTKEQFAHYWNMAYNKLLSKPPLPEIDFEKENVLLVAAGTKFTGGYNIYISSEKPTIKGQSILLTVILETPGKECIVTEALTSPFTFYTMEKKIAPLSFMLKEKTIDCNQK